MLASAAFLGAIAAGAWEPMLVAAALTPGACALYLAKPNVGLVLASGLPIRRATYIGIGVAVLLFAASLIIQIASLAFWLPLEIYQMETLGHPTFVIALRFENIVAFALGKVEAWGLDTEAMHWDAWDYVHITTWNFLPFLLRRVGASPNWVVDVAFAVWGAGIVALSWVLLLLGKIIRLTNPDPRLGE